MKSIVTCFCFLLCACSVLQAQKTTPKVPAGGGNIGAAAKSSPKTQSGSGGYNIRVKIKNNHDKVRYLGFYYGDKQYLKDTVTVDDNGVSVFKGDKPLPGGIYFVMMPSHRYFEILIGEQNFDIETDTTDFIKTMKVKNSPTNVLFNDYQAYITKIGSELNDLNTRFTAHKTNKDSTKAIGALIDAKNKELNNYRYDVIHKHPESVLSMIFTIMKEPTVPEKPKDNPDSFFAYHYYKAHYWDDMQWGDRRILRTPIFHGKLKDYFDKYALPDPDSIIASCDYVMQHSKADSEVYKYTLTYLTHNYETSKIMGYDSIFCHMARVYYIENRAWWVDSAQFAKLYDRWWKEDKNRLGVYAHELNLEDTNGVSHSLYSVNSKYTVVAFWDSQCSHCQHDIPRLDSFYRNVFKERGIDVFAVDIEAEKGKGTWKKFIKEHKLTWLNVWDPHNQSNFRQYYDIYSTPVFYLLDKNKRIQAKRIDIDQILEIVNHLEKINEKKAGGAAPKGSK